MTKHEIIKELIGDAITELIADDLKDTYASLIESLDENEVRIFDDNYEEDVKQIKALLMSVKHVYSWYSTEELT